MIKQIKQADNLRELAKIAKRQRKQYLVMIYFHNMALRRKKPLAADTEKGA